MVGNQIGLDFYKAIYSYFLKRVHSSDIAEDLTQDVFLKIINTRADKEIHSLKAWIFTIAKNTLIDHYRAKKPEEKFMEERHGVEANEELEYKEVSRCILSMMSSLDSEDRMLLHSIEIEQISQKSLSEKLNMNYTTLKSKVQRARKNLHNKLTSCCSFENDSRGNTSFCKNKNDESC